MKTRVNKCDFMDRFRRFDRYEQFGYDALSALYDYLEQYEDDTGEEIELDVIALCCEYTNYDDLEDIQSNYTDIKDMDDLRDHTQVIEHKSGIVIQDF